MSEFITVVSKLIRIYIRKKTANSVQIVSQFRSTYFLLVIVLMKVLLHETVIASKCFCCISALLLLIVLFL